MKITVTYTSIDRCRKRRVYKTLEGARKFAHEWVGPHPDMGTGYAVSDDGVGKVEVSGASLADLFPAMKSVEDAAKNGDYGCLPCCDGCETAWSEDYTVFPSDVFHTASCSDYCEKYRESIKLIKDNDLKMMEAIAAVNTEEVDCPF